MTAKTQPPQSDGTPAGNLALSERFVAAVLSGETDKLDALLHPQFALHHSSTVPYTGVYKGAAGFMEFLGIFMGTYDLEKLETVNTFTSADGTVVVDLVIRGTLKSSGQLVDTTMLEKWEFRDGLVWRITPHYFDPNPVN